MSTRSLAWGVSLSLLLSLLSCILAPGQLDWPPRCQPGERAFNGDCRKTCEHTADCPGGTQCMTVDVGAALCLDYTRCTHLDNDTECIGFGKYTAGTRFGQETLPYSSDPPNANPHDATPYQDPYFDSAYGVDEADGCEGNATWIESVAGGDPACGAKYAVRRCRRVGAHACGLVSGTTMDFVSP